MSRSFETFDQRVAFALAENKRVMDLLQLDEDVMWSALNDSVESGHRTYEQAEQEFMDWRDNMRTLGGIAVKPQAE